MRTIAVIDDDIHIGSFLEELLQREGYQTREAYDGEDAWPRPVPRTRI